jgi:hypothetical protein
MVFVSKTDIDATIVKACGERTWLKFQKPAKDHLLLVEFKNKKAFEKLIHTCVEHCIFIGTKTSIKLRDVQMVQEGDSVYKVHTRVDLKRIFKNVHPDGYMSKAVAEHILLKVYKSQKECFEYMDAIGARAYSQGKKTVQLSHL